MPQPHFTALKDSHPYFLILLSIITMACALLLINLARAEATGADPGAQLDSSPPPSPGVVSFSTSSYSVKETDSNLFFPEAGNAAITLKRTGGTDNKVVTEVALADVTTSPADYRYRPDARDASFSAVSLTGGAGFGLSTMALQADGKILVGGDFYGYNNDNGASDRILRLHTDGRLDTTFNYGFGKGAHVEGVNDTARVSDIAVQADGKILIGGYFSEYNGDHNASDHIQRLNADGSLDTTFNYGSKGTDGFTGLGSVSTVAVQADGKILIGGFFDSYNGDHNASDYIQRLNADGSLDTTFNYGSKGTDGIVSDIVVQPDGKILIAGQFSAYNGDMNANDRIARLNTDGTLDTTFNYGSGAGAFGAALGSRGMRLALQPDGKIIIGGDFSNYNGDQNASDGIARLNADGTLDVSFNYGSEKGVRGIQIIRSRPLNASYIDAVGLQPDGKILISGQFISYNGDPNATSRLLRLNTDGTLDTTFNYSNVVLGTVADVLVQPDGRILASGGGVVRLLGGLFVTWEAGDSADKTIRLPIINDALDEGNETLALTLIPILGGATAGTPSTATLTIVDNDPSVSQVSGEGVIDGMATLRAKLTSGGAPLSGKVVNFSLNGANVGQAATDASGVATLANVSVAGMAAGTYPNAVGASFSGDASFVGSGGTGPLTITVTPVVRLSSSTYSASEAAGRATVTVTRNFSTGAATVQYATSDTSGLNNCNVNTGNASARCDYTAAGGTLNFAAGELSKTFTIPLVNDVYVEGDEALTVTLMNATGSSLDGPSTATVAIIDDDNTTPEAANPIDTREFFIRQLYLDTLNREPDPPGLAAWLNRLNTCPRPGETLQNCDEIEVASAFFRSPEFFDRSFFLYKFYEGSLTFQPLYEQFLSDLRRLTGFLTPEELELRKQQFAEEFVNRPNFRAQYDLFLDGQPFVDAVLARAGTSRPGFPTTTIVPANRESVINRLAARQITRGQALRELMESAEMSRTFYNRAFVIIGYFSFLRRDTDIAYLQWISTLNTTRDYREMIRGFIQSPEYRFRFGPR